MTGSGLISNARDIPVAGQVGRPVLGAVFAVVVAGLSSVAGPMGSAFAQDDPATSYVCSPPPRDTVDPIQQNLDFVFEGPGKLALPQGDVRVVRIPEGTQMRGRVDGGEGPATTGRLKQVRVSVKIGVVPTVEKPDDTTKPWTVSLAVMETEYDHSVLAKPAAKALEAEIEALDVRLGQWRSAPLPGEQKERLQKVGTLTLAIDQAFDPESKLRPSDNPVTVVVVNRPENPRGLYAKARALKQDQDQFNRMDREAVKIERSLAREMKAAEAFDKALAVAEGTGLLEDFLKARTLLLAAKKPAPRIRDLRWKKLIQLQDERQAVLTEKESIKLFVDKEAQYIKREPGRGYLPLDEVMKRTENALNSLRRTLRDRYELQYSDGSNPLLQTLQDIDSLIASDARLKLLIAKTSRLDKLKADFLRQLSEKDETVAEIDRRIADVWKRINDLKKLIRTRENRYRQEYGNLDGRLRALAADLKIKAPRISLATAAVTPEALENAMDWVEQQQEGLRFDVAGKWKALGTLYENFLQADQQLAVTIRKLLKSRESAAIEVCKELAKLDNSEDYSKLLGAISGYISLIRYAPAFIIMPLPSTFEIAIGKDIQGSYTRQVVRNATNRFIKNLPLRSKFAQRFIIGAKIYKNTFTNLNTALKLLKVANALKNDNRSAIFEGLSLASSFTSKVPIMGGLLGLSFDIYGVAGKTILAAGNWIADRRVMEALEAVRERPDAESPERKLYSVADIKGEHHFKVYAVGTSDTDVKRIATVFQVEYIIALLSKARR